MKCITQRFRKLMLIRKYTVTDRELINDIYLMHYMNKNNWEDDLKSSLNNMMIFERGWKNRYVRRLKRLK